MKPQAVFDIECYPNFFLIMFMRLSDMETISFRRTDSEEIDSAFIRKVIRKYELIDFNGNKYDIPMLKLALTGATNEKLKYASDQLIASYLTPWAFDKEYKLPDLNIDHVDLIEVAPGQGSLKLYGARIHTRYLQDLPIEPDKHLTVEEMHEIEKYCKKDLLSTFDNYQKLKPQIDLRREMSKIYNQDLRSKSDAQIAEAVMKSEIFKKTKERLQKRDFSEHQFLYDIPDFIKLGKSRSAIDVISKLPFTVTSTGRIEMPKALSELKIRIGNTQYQLGMGGLHSTESKVSYKADERNLLADFDVTSYYPAIILNCKLFPKHIGPIFLDVYRSIVEERIAAKISGDEIKNQALKITINGGFGKLGSPYSVLFAPKLMVQVTVTGQLSLLMLIEMLEEQKISVVSANTDGIVVKCPHMKEVAMLGIIAKWEEMTEFNMERSDYTALYSRDVNNYIAVKKDKSTKAKGFLSSPNLKKNPLNEICCIAIAEFLSKEIPIEDTIAKCEDLTKFITVRNVKGGAVQGETYLGKTVRWYYSTKTRNLTINYKNNGNTVPKSKGAKPVMDLPDIFPDDIDYKLYIQECEDMLSSIGVFVRGQMDLGFGG